MIIYFLVAIYVYPTKNISCKKNIYPVLPSRLFIQVLFSHFDLVMGNHLVPLYRDNKKHYDIQSFLLQRISCIWSYKCNWAHLYTVPNLFIKREKNVIFVHNHHTNTKYMVCFSNLILRNCSLSALCLWQYFDR